MSILHAVILGSILAGSPAQAQNEINNYNRNRNWQQGPRNMRYDLINTNKYLKKQSFKHQELNLPSDINDAAWIIDQQWLINNFEQIFDSDAVLENFKLIWDVRVETFSQGLKVSVQFGMRTWKVSPSPWITFKIKFIELDFENNRDDNGYDNGVNINFNF